MNKIGILTIGQSPRVDVIPDIVNVLGNEIEIIEHGILDNFTEEEAISTFYPEKNDTVLVSRLRTGREIKMAEDKVYTLVQEYISLMESENIHKVLLLCTGKFPDFKFNGILIKPFDIVHSVVKSLANDRKIGLIVPNEDQICSSTESWSETGVDVLAKSASPYDEDTLKLMKVSERFKDEDIPFIVLDCMGYSVKMKKIVQERSGKPVILSRTIVARVIKELF